MYELRERENTQATSNRVTWEEHGTYPLNPMGHNVNSGVTTTGLVFLSKVTGKYQTL